MHLNIALDGASHIGDTLGFWMGLRYFRISNAFAPLSTTHADVTEWSQSEFLWFFSLKFWLSAHNNHFCKLRPFIVRMQRLCTSAVWTVTAILGIWYPLMGSTSHPQGDMGHPSCRLSRHTLWARHPSSFILDMSQLYDGNLKLFHS